MVIVHIEGLCSTSNASCLPSSVLRRPVRGFIPVAATLTKRASAEEPGPASFIFRIHATTRDGGQGSDDVLIG